MTADYEPYQPGPPDGPLSLDTQRAVTAVKAAIDRDHRTVQLVIMHPTRSADEIVKALMIEPTEISNPGELLVPGYSLAFDETWCRFETSEELGHIIETHVQYLLDLFEGFTPTLRLWLSEGASLNMKIKTYAWARTQSLMFSAETLSRLAHLRVNLDVMYHYENSEADY